MILSKPVQSKSDFVPTALQTLSDKIVEKEIFRKINRIISPIYATPKKPELDANRIIIGNYTKLWLGNMNAAKNYDFIVGCGIKNIINVTTDIPNYFPFVEYLTLPIKDQDACRYNLLNVLEAGADYINKCISKNSSILIHCKRGHHRSASIIAYYLMKYRHYSLENAILLIKSYRATTFRKMTCILKILIKYEYQRCLMVHDVFQLAKYCDQYLCYPHHYKGYYSLKQLIRLY